MRTTALLSLGIILSFTACSSATSSGPTPVDVAANMEGTKQRSMQNCPSALPGTKTEMTEIDGGLALAITAADATTTARIRQLAREQGDIRAAAPSELEHTGRGTGRGALGFCPILHVGTDVTVDDIDGGVRVTVRPKQKEKVAEIREMTKERIAALTPAS